MPDMDGFATLAKLKTQGVSGSRFVALSVRGDADAKEKALKAGFVAVVEKPIQADALTALLAAGGEGDDGSDGFVAEEAGCPVLVVPDPDAQAKSFGRFLPAAQKALRAMAEDGNDRLIVDLAAVTVVNTALVKCVVEVMAQAMGMGLKTAVCASGSTAKALKDVAETRDALYAETRQAARAAVG